MNSKKIYVLAGGTGLIGGHLADSLRQQGHEVRILTRKPQGAGQYAWNPAAGTIDTSAVEGAHAIINLAGAGIADGRWTQARKRELIDSRVDSARALYNALQAVGTKPAVYVGASAIGIYGDTGDAWLSEETAPAGNSFMVDCCRQWEQATQSIAALSIRTVVLRIGIVLAKEGGALAEIARPIRFGAGTYFGDGQAWYSWIHRDDVCNMLQWAADQSQLEGIYNAVAPQPERNKELTRLCIEAMDASAVLLPAPAIALRLMLGEMSAVVLNSNRVSAKKIETTGFVFQYPQLGPALRAIFK